MADSRRLKGKFYVRAGGMLLASAADAEVNVKKGGVKRDPVTLVDGETYFTEQEVTASIEITCKLLRGMTLEELNGMTDVTVTVEADDGWSGVMANAFCAGDLSMGKGGEVKLTFYGSKIEESTN